MTRAEHEVARRQSESRRRASARLLYRHHNDITRNQQGTRYTMTERREPGILDVGGGQTLGPAWRNTIAFAAGDLPPPPPPPPSQLSTHLRPTDSFLHGLESPRFDPLHPPPSSSRARNSRRSPRKLTVRRAVALRCVDVTK